MKATQELKNEHSAVLVALQILDKVTAAIAAKDDRAPADLEKLLDFFKGFVDRCHHGKEEDVLFPELMRRGVQREGGPIGVMRSDHEVGRGHVRAMTDGVERLRRGDADAAAAIREHATAYSDMLRAHIDRENNVLFIMADCVVPEDVAERLLEQFEAIERDRVGEGKHEAYHAVLHELKDRYGVAPEG
jgi:hemerythrin-like domain-containing protein